MPISSRYVNRFSWNTDPNFAERRFIATFFKQFGFRFRKIRTSNKNKTPDGWILDCDGRKIALAEIKLIRFKVRPPRAVSRITIDRTIRRALDSAKNQLETREDELPRIVLLIADDHFVSSDSVRDALFGEWITTMRGEEIIFEGHRSWNYKNESRDLMLNHKISAVFSCHSTPDGYQLMIIQDTNSFKIPHIFHRKKWTNEHWLYTRSEKSVELKNIST